MGLRINTNINALTALTNLRRTDSALGQSLQRLSTGLRINTASDDPAGLVISEQFRAQIAGLNQAVENTEFDSNLLGTAEAALQEISDLLVKVRESAIFAKNTGGISDEQVEAEQDSVDSAIAAIDRIASTTRFGRRNLIDGSAGFVTSNVTAGITDLSLRSVYLQNGLANTVTMSVAVMASQAGLAIGAPAINTGSDVQIRITGELGSEVISFFSTANVGQISNAVNAVREFTGVYAAGGTFLSETYGSDVAIQVELVAGTAAAGLEGRDSGTDIVVRMNGAQVDADGLDVRVNSAFLKGELTFSQGIAAGPFSFTVVEDTGLVFQLGGEPTASDQIRVGIDGVDASRLGFSEIQLPGPNGQLIGGFLSSLTAGGDNDLKTNPSNAMRIVDKALDQVNGLRGFLGALLADTLEPNQRSLSVAVENLTASESRIRDLDFAAETATFTRNQILFNAGTSVLATANLIPQQVLSLLGG